jgi:hypothetical protein
MESEPKKVIMTESGIAAILSPGKENQSDNSDQMIKIRRE